MAISTIVSIVEGHGEIEALPIVLRRVLAENNIFDRKIEKPIRSSRASLLKPGGIERAVELAARQVDEAGILIVLDSDGDPPCTLGPALLQRARSARRDRVIGLALAHREWESWYVAAIQSIAGKRKLRSGLLPPQDPESIQGAKEWLGRNMEGGRKYSETVDQPAFAELFDLNAARQVSSFAKFCREVQFLVKGAHHAV